MKRATYCNVTFEKKEIALDIHENGETEGEWIIMPCSNCVVSLCYAVTADKTSIT